MVLGNNSSGDQRVIKMSISKELDSIVLEDRVNFNLLLRSLVVQTLNYKADLYEKHILYQ